MTGVYRLPEFRPMLADDLVEDATSILDALAETLQQSCQLALRLDDGFCIALQSTPSSACFVNMPVGLFYPAPENVVDARGRDVTAQHTNPALPDVIDICAPVCRGQETIALIIAPCIKRRGAPSPEQCRQAVQSAAQRLGQSFIVKALVA